MLESHSRSAFRRATYLDSRLSSRVRSTVLRVAVSFWIDLDRALLSWSDPLGSELSGTTMLVSMHAVCWFFQLGIAKEIASEWLAGLPAMSQRPFSGILPVLL